MKTRNWLDIALLMLLILTSCNPRQLEYDNVINKTFEYIHQDYQSKTFIACNKDSIFLIDTLEKIKSGDIEFIANPQLFSQHEIADLVKQNNKPISYQLKNGANNKIILLPVDSLEQFRQKNQYRIPVYSISKPVFSGDYQKALIAVDFLCPECGSGKLLFLKKTNNEWKVISVKDTWIN